MRYSCWSGGNSNNGFKIESAKLSGCDLKVAVADLGQGLTFVDENSNFGLKYYVWRIFRVNIWS